VAEIKLIQPKSCDQRPGNGEDNVMSEGNTVRLHRVLATKPEKVFRAFLDADALAKWLPPYGFTCKVHQMEAKVGGTFRMSFTNFTTGNGHSFGGEYLEIVPNERIRYTDRFDDPNLPGVIEVTVTLKPVSCGTEINIEQANLPKMIPVEACYLGWQQSLAQLALVVEPDIPE
jgi:uncharacterized protein YndB with AHSA1/START domain